ncbi:MAG: hypothetical protein KDN18_05150, partial [Verrucomicrobiae bacterium]|nr:hypothetical protein [Verrucomicrobiae bacterium]
MIGILSVLVLGLMPDEVEAQKWNTNNSGNWGDSTKWTPNTVPDGAGVTANLSFNITATRTITLDIDPTVGTLIFGDTNNTHAFIISGGTLTFDNDDNGALLNHNSATASLSPSGSDRIDSNVVIADLLGLTIDADRNLEFRGAWDGGNSTINLINTGRVFWNNNTGGGTISNLGVLNILNGEARFDGVSGTANSQLIGATTINLGDGFVTTGGTGFRFFPRLNLVNTETTQTATLNLNGGWLTSDLGSNDNLDIWSGNINLTGAANTNIVDVNDAGTADTHIVSGVIGGSGGFSKINNGTLELTANNVLSGEIYIQRGGVGGTALVSEGAIRISGSSGSLSQVGGVTISRDGSLYLDNSSSTNGNRFNDLGSLTLRGSGRLRMIGNASSAVSETLGTLIQDTGSGKVNFDLDDTTPQATSLTFATYQRNPGSITQFQVIENTPGAFGSALGGDARLFIADSGASSVRLGGGGVNGGTAATNRTLLVGAYGGVNNISNHFMTFDDASPTELRPLTWTGTQATSEYFLSRDSLSPAHQFTRAGLGGVDQNVNLNFNVGIEGDIGTGLPGSGSDYGWYGQAPMAILENVAMNSLRFGTNTPSSTVNTNNTNEIGSTLVLAPGAILYLGDKAADSELPAISSSGSGMILFGRDVDGTSPGSNQVIAGGVLSFGSREALLVNESGNSALFRSNIRGTGGLTKAGSSFIYLDNSNSYSGDTNIAEGVLVLRDRNALGASGLVKIEGNGQLYLELGTQVIDNTAGPTPPDLFVGVIDASRPVLYSNNSNNTWGGNVIIDTVDNLGNWVYTARIATNTRDTLNIEGDIYGNEIANPINTDIALNDARLVSTTGGSSSGGIINLNGRVRDNALGSISSPVNSNNENQLLRFQIGSSNELIVNVRQQWDAAGIILLDQGILRYEGEGNFWSDTAAANLNAASSQSGFRMGGSAGSSSNNNNSSLNSAFILTKPGQVLNIG